MACQGVEACIDRSGTGNATRVVPSTPPNARPPPIGQLAVRVYFPSLDRPPQNARLLSGCRRFPLVIFVHGDCDGNPYEQWVDIPAQLARSGYIVAVTNYGGKLATGDAADTMPLHLVYNWIRNFSSYANSRAPAPNTAVMGHSYGGTLAAQLLQQMFEKPKGNTAYGNDCVPTSIQMRKCVGHSKTLLRGNALIRYAARQEGSE